MKALVVENENVTFFERSPGIVFDHSCSREVFFDWFGVEIPVYMMTLNYEPDKNIFLFSDYESKVFRVNPEENGIFSWISNNFSGIEAKYRKEHVRELGRPTEYHQFDEVLGKWVVSQSDLLIERKADARSKVDAKEAEKRSSFPWDFGAPHGVLHLQIRGTEDQANWLTLQNTASAYISAGQGAEAVLGIRTQENVTVPVTANDAMTIMLSMAGFGGNTKARAWAIKDLIEVATTVAAVQAVLDAELDTGWPIDSMTTPAE